MPPVTRMVNCIKLDDSLLDLPHRPFNDALGQRIYDTVSSGAWKLWIEHSKKIVNEHHLDLTVKRSHDVLEEQGEELRFRTAGAVPEGHADGTKH